MFAFPGHSYRGPISPPTADEKLLSAKLSTHVWMLASEIGARSLTSAPENLEKAALYIEQMLASFGYEVGKQEFTTKFSDPKRWQAQGMNIQFETSEFLTRNVIAELRGKKHPEEIVVIGAHYDSVFDCPAANDNGSGVAATLEIARALFDQQFEKTIRFVLFTNEEPPFFTTEDMGSFQYAKRCKELSEKIVAMLSLETIGYYTDEPNSQQFPSPVFGAIYPNTGNFISFVSNVQSIPLTTQCVSAFRKAVEFPSEGIAIPALVTGVDFSDHRSFWQFGYPGVMVTDTAMFRYPHYHDSADTPDKINYDVLARVVTGLTHVVRDLAKPVS